MSIEKVMLLIDADNVSVDVMEQALRLMLNQHGFVHVRRAYCTAESAVANQATFKRLGIKPMVNLAAGKNSTDIAMAVDAIDLVLSERPDVVVIASSDSDFAPLVQRLREKGCVVRGVGQKGKTSDETQDVYDDFTVLEHHRASGVTARPRGGRRAEAREPVRRAGVGAAARGGRRRGAQSAAELAEPSPLSTMPQPAPEPEPLPEPLPEQLPEPPIQIDSEAPAADGPVPSRPARKAAAKKVAAKKVPAKKAPAKKAAASRKTAAAATEVAPAAPAVAEIVAPAAKAVPAKKAPARKAARKTALQTTSAPATSTPPASAPALEPIPTPAPAPAPLPVPVALGGRKPPTPGIAEGGRRASALSLDAVLACLPELGAGQTMALNVAAQRLREAQLLSRSGSSLKLLAQFGERFELLPRDKPHQVRLRSRR